MFFRETKSDKRKYNEINMIIYTHSVYTNKKRNPQFSFSMDRKKFLIIVVLTAEIRILDESG